MSIDLDRMTRLTILVRTAPHGMAEEEAATPEEKEFVAELRANPPEFVETLPADFEISAQDSPDFDYDRWEADGFPDNEWDYVGEYKPKSYLRARWDFFWQRRRSRRRR